MRIALLLAATLMLSCTVALAAPDTGGVPDADFTTRYFGTTAVFHAPQRVDYDPNLSWWGEKVSPELTNNPAYIIGIVNSRRMAQSVPLLDPNDYSLIQVNAEELGTEGYRYTIDFADMRPAEVEALIGMLGGPAKVVPGTARVSYEPLPRRYIYASGWGEQPAILNLAGRKITVSPGMTLDQVRALIDQAFQASMGRSAYYDLTLTQSRYMDGSTSIDVSLSVDLNFDPTLAHDSHEGHSEYDG